MIVYFNGHFLPKQEVRVSPDDRGFLFGDGAYEVIRSYGGRLFQAEAHLARMERSLRELRLAGPAAEHLREIVEKLAALNDLQHRNAIFYVQVSRGVAPRAHPFPGDETPPTVYACVSAFQTSRMSTSVYEKLERGVKVILVPDIRWARCDIKSLALLPNVLASQQARESGAEEAVFVRDGAITEGTHTNFCAVFDGQLVTHPRTHHILAGITRGIVLDLCGELGIPVAEFPIFEGQLREADELMIMSTTTEVTPVVQVGDWPVGDGEPGPMTRKLQQAFRERTRSPL